MRIKVHGQERQASDGATILSLLAEHKLSPDKVAVELNRKLVRTGQYEQALREGDEVEIVTFVGGG